MPEKNTYSSEQCARCGNSFVCRPGDIGSCNCNQVIISKPEYDYISAHFSDCICNNCLEDMKQEYHHVLQERSSPSHSKNTSTH